jgi:hypothetical protein
VKDDQLDWMNGCCLLADRRRRRQSCSRESLGVGGVEVGKWPIAISRLAWRRLVCVCVETTVIDCVEQLASDGGSRISSLEGKCDYI